MDLANADSKAEAQIDAILERRAREARDAATVEKLWAESPGTTETFPIAAGADDQEVSKTGSSYPPTSAVARNSTGENTQAERKYRSFSTPPVSVACALLKFDTSALPDAATVTAATLRVYVQNKGNPDSRNFRGEYYLFDGTDLDYTEDGASGTTAFDVTIASVALASNDFPLTNLASISKTGFTGLRLHASGGAPTGDKTTSGSPRSSTPHKPSPSS